MILPSFLVAACAMSNPAAPTAPAKWVAPPPAPVAAKPAAKPAAPEAATDAAPAGAADAQAPAQQPPAAAATPAASPTDMPIASVAGKPIFASELMSQWLYAGRSEAREQIENLVLGRLVVAEATRLGVRVDPALAERTYTRGLEAIEKEIQASRKTFEDFTLDRYVDQYLGLDPQRYRERLRDDSLRTLLGERVVRGWLLQNDHAFLRLIVVKSEEAKKAVEAALAAGTAFEEVAKQHSADASAKDGGRLAPIVRGSGPIASLAFATEPGKVGGPIAERDNFLFVFIEKRGAPLEGDWSVLGPVVEQSIAEHHVDQLELEQWRRAMQRRYTIDMSPFLRLAGEPIR